jgi:imidazolonepropionase-like amidohydrolase
MTLQPAQAAGLQGLGVLRPGAIADIIAISPDWLDRSESDGTYLTIIAGQLIWHDGQFMSP